MTNQIQTLKDLRNKLPESYIAELAKVSNAKEAEELARIFFTYQALYDDDHDHKNKLKDCSVSSIMHCLVSCASTGLWPNAAIKYVYIVPINGKADFKIDYKGLVKLMSDHSSVKVVKAGVVREGETVDPHTFDHQWTFETLNNPIIGAFALVKLTNGEVISTALGTKDLDAIESCAKTKRVWEKWGGEMAKKAALRRVSKMVLPQLKGEQGKVDRLQAAINIEHKEYDLGRTIDSEPPATADEVLELLEEEEK